MGINDDENHIHIVKKLVKWFKDSLSSVRDLCHLVDVAIASIWAMDHGPMPNKARAGSLWRVSFRSGAGSSLSSPFGEAKLQLLQLPFLCFTEEAKEVDIVFTGSVVSYIPVLCLLGFCSCCNEWRSNISLLQGVLLPFYNAATFSLFTWIRCLGESIQWSDMFKINT